MKIRIHGGSPGSSIYCGKKDHRGKRFGGEGGNRTLDRWTSEILLNIYVEKSNMQYSMILEYRRR
jgi:hypothetical protein